MRGEGQSLNPLANGSPETIKILMTIETPRLILVPMTAELVGLEIHQPEQFRTLLGADIPENWPPEMIRDALPWFANHLTAQPQLAG